MHKIAGYFRYIKGFLLFLPRRRSRRCSPPVSHVVWATSCARPVPMYLEYVYRQKRTDLAGSELLPTLRFLHPRAPIEPPVSRCGRPACRYVDWCPRRILADNPVLFIGWCRFFFLFIVGDTLSRRVTDNRFWWLILMTKPEWSIVL